MSLERAAIFAAASAALFFRNDIQLVRLKGERYRELYGRLLRHKFVRNTQNPVFVDAGANVGQGLKLFSKLFPPDRFSYEIYEPNPACVAQLRETTPALLGSAPWQLHQAAVWTEDTELPFFGPTETGTATTVSGTVVAQHLESHFEVEPDQAEMVPARDALAIFRDLQEKHDLIVAKIDIEGAELPVLRRLWANAKEITVPVILFVEFHAHFAESPARERLLSEESEIKQSTPEPFLLAEWH